MSKQKTKQSEPFFSNGFGWDIDLNEENCAPETWAFLNRPDEERGMPLNEWQALYTARIASGYYTTQTPTIDTDLPF